MDPTKQMGQHSSDTKEHHLQTSQGHETFEGNRLKFPYHEYKANLLQPCAVTSTGHILPVHLLACGHLVAIDNLGGPPDNRCGTNCLHVAMWMKEQATVPTKDNLVFHTESSTHVSLGQPLASSTPAQVAECFVMPKNTEFQAQHNIYCEVCHGIPTSSFFVGNRETLLKRAIALTRIAIEYHTGYSQHQILDRLCLPFHNSDHLGYDWKLTHTLVCGHEVWAQPARPCACNCSDGPQCKGRIFPGNEKQTDVIFCHECTYRAELVYERYAKAQESAAFSAFAQPLSGVLVPHAEWDNSQGVNYPSTGFAHETSSESEGHSPSTTVDDLPLDTTLDGHGLATHRDTMY